MDAVEFELMQTRTRIDTIIEILTEFGPRDKLISKEEYRTVYTILNNWTDRIFVSLDIDDGFEENE